jgi:hypothetical protein
MAPWSVRSRKLINVGQRMGDQKCFSQASLCFGRHVMLLSRLHLQSLAPTNAYWSRGGGLWPVLLAGNQ